MFRSRFGDALYLGLRSLAAHRLRSGLTALGIVLGVGSVIVMLAVGEAARHEALKQLEDLGANTILLRSKKPTQGPAERQATELITYGITYKDVDRIRETIPTVSAVTPRRELRKTIRYRSRKLEVRVLAVTPDFLRQGNMRLAHGQWIDDLHEKQFANVAVLGAAAAETLFPTQDPVGRSVSIEDPNRLRSFTVIGVTEPKTLAAGGDSGDVDFSRVMFIPFATDRSRLGLLQLTIKPGSFQAERLEVSQLTVTVRDVKDVVRTVVVIQSLMDQFHLRKDVLVIVPLDLLEKAEKTQRIFTLILGAIAGISLVVGGIGIMNIMLATVTERTREIGIRRALGAKRRDIAIQFLAETLLLSCFGGLLGIFLGVGLAFAVSRLFGLPTIIQLWSPLVAFAVSVIVGLVSGGYPAHRAARLDPIEALRHE